jgi:glycosyltransferase involved in cell wall biosynthesis
MSNLFLKEAIPVTEQNWADDIQPVVSVFNWSYNHVNFIRQSIESILEQKTTFPIEIIIHDDASNDGTIEIIKEYESKYPQLFRNIIQKENQWSQGKSVMDPLFKLPRGKYIALTHGDDYWTDPYKLQRQVEFLEGSEKYVLIFHPVNLHYQNGVIETDHITYVPEQFESFESLAKYGNYIHTSSVLFRNVINEMPSTLSEIPFGDYVLYLLLAQYGLISKLNYTMSVYRKNIGVWSSLSFEDQLFKLHHGFVKLASYYRSIDNSSAYHIFLNRIKNYIIENIKTLSVAEIQVLLNKNYDFTTELIYLLSEENYSHNNKHIHTEKKFLKRISLKNKSIELFKLIIDKIKK